MSFDRFEHDDHEPASVVRTLADLSLMLVLMFMMMVGQRATPATPLTADTRAAAKRPGGSNSDVNVALAGDGKFRLLPDGGEPLTAEALATKLHAPGMKPMIAIVLQFPSDTLASQLHAALLNLQAAFTNTTIQTVPEK